MSIVFDIILLVVIVFSTMRGMYKGFVRTFMKLISFAGSVVLTFLLYNPVSEYIYNLFVYKGVSGYIQSSFDRDVASVNVSLEKLFSDMPEFFENFLERFTSQATASEKFSDGTINSTDKLVEWISTPIATTLSKVIAFVGLFIILYIALKLLTRVLDRVAKLPVLNGLNKFLGLVLGLVLGVLTAWILAIAFNSLIPVCASLFPKVFGGATIDQTIITQALYKFNIFSILKLINF